MNLPGDLFSQIAKLQWLQVKSLTYDRSSREDNELKKLTGGVNQSCTVAQWQMNGATSPL